ncbi:MAG: ChaN family lipoprotein [Planctomycetes bacterium]|nr:ChaN family lipoprotein [Planctomycetota bacterium]
MRLLAVAAMVLALSACTAPRTARVLSPIERDATAQALVIRDGTTGDRIDLDEAARRAARADVVLLGEYHDNPDAHALQQALYARLLEREPRTALCLEMLERHEQPIVDAWVRGEITTDQLIDRTGSRTWSGQPNSWMAFYQPCLDLARTHGAAIVAANAPRQYVSRANREGYEGLLALPPDERALFDLPIAPDVGAYRHRLAELMQEMRGSNASVPDDQVDRMLRSQLVWDATMGASVARALESSPRAVVLVGCFHSDFLGGTALEILARRPGTSVFVVAITQETGDGLASGDRGRGDLVVRVGDGLSLD